MPTQTVSFGGEAIPVGRTALERQRGESTPIAGQDFQPLLPTVRQLEGTLTEREAELADLRRRHDAVLGSTSWKATAWIRWTLDRLRGYPRQR